MKKTILAICLLTAAVVIGAGTNQPPVGATTNAPACFVTATVDTIAHVVPYAVMTPALPKGSQDSMPASRGKLVDDLIPPEATGQFNLAANLYHDCQVALARGDTNKYARLREQYLRIGEILTARAEALKNASK